MSTDRTVRWINTLTALMAVTAVSSIQALSHHGTALRPSGWWMVLVIAVAFGLAERTVFHFEFRREAISASISEVPLVLALVYLPPWQAVAARIVGSLLIIVLQWRSPLHKLLFNAALFTLEIAVAYRIIGLVTGAFGHSTTAMLFGAALAAAVPTLIDAVLVSAVISLVEGGFKERALYELRLFGWIAPLNSMAAAALLAPALMSPWLLVVSVVPIVALWTVMRAHGNLEQKFRDLDDLHGFVRKVGPSLDIDELVQTAAAEAAERFTPQAALIAALRAELPENGILVDEVTQIGHVMRLFWPAIAGIVLLFFAYSMAKSMHPEWMIHATVQTHFSWQVFTESIQRYNWFLQHTYSGRPPLLGCGIIAFTALLIATPSSKSQWLGFLGILLLPLVLLAIEKTTDGTENIFFGYGRFFLAIPFAWGWFFSGSGFSLGLFKRLWDLPIKKTFSISSRFLRQSAVVRVVYFIGLFAAVGLYGYRFWDRCSIRELGKTYVPVMIYPINQLRGDAEKMAQLCKSEHIGAVVVLDHYVLETASMGFAHLANFPLQSEIQPSDTLPDCFKIHNPIPIIRPKYERRHWLLKEIKEQKYVPHKVAVMDVFKDSAWGDRLPFKHQLADVRGPVFIFETGEMTLSDFITKFLE